MNTILVTGSEGFIGKNLVSRLKQHGEYEILTFDKDSSTPLNSLVEKADFIFHLAGVNRPQNEAEFKTGNLDLTAQVVEYARSTKTPILITSSIQAILDNPYGKSKLGAEELLQEYAQETGAPVYIFRLPNVFGKWSRPNYNSVVATFCYNISHGLPLQVNDPAAPITLVYIDEVIDEFIRCIEAKKEVGADGFCHIPREYPTTVGDLAKRLQDLHDIRATTIIPDLSDPLTKYLYATLTSLYEQDDYASLFDMHDDERGWLFELAKSKQFGQVFVSKTKPGFTRGKHWHHTKVERFCIIEGSGKIAFRKVDSQEVFTYLVSGEKIQIIDIPVGYVHSVQNTGETDMIMIIWANEILDKENPDTWYEEVSLDKET